MILILMCPLKTQRDYALLSRIHRYRDNALYGGALLAKICWEGAQKIFKDWGVICQKCQFEVRKNCSHGQKLRTSIVKSLFMVCQRHGFHAQPGVLGIMCFSHCPGSSGTDTRFCRETDNFVNMRFLGLFWTQTMSHLRAFVANQVCREYAFFWVCFVQTFTQTLRILLRFCADICPKNWRLRPLVHSFVF